MDPANLSWQGFVIGSLGGLLGLSYFLGKLATRVAALERQNEENSEVRKDIQRLRSAYHAMAGFMQIHHREWAPYNLDKE